MDKKALRKEEIPEYPKSLKRKKIGSNYVIAAKRANVGRRDTLILAVYRNKKLEFVHYCQKKDYTTLSKDNKWLTSSFKNLVGYFYYSAITSTDEDEQIVKEFVKKIHPGFEGKHYNLVSSVEYYQSDIRRRKLCLRHKADMNLIDIQMNKFAKLPKSFPKFVKDKVFKDDYRLIYDLKSKMATCTHCQTKHPLKGSRNAIQNADNTLSPLKNSEKVVCPTCGRTVTAISTGRRNDDIIKWSLKIEEHQGQILTRYFVHVLSCGVDESRIRTRERFRVVNYSKASRTYMFGEYKKTGIMRWCDYREPYGMYYSKYNWPNVQTPVLYDSYKKITAMVNRSELKYSCLGTFLKNTKLDGLWLADNWIEAWQKNPQIELIIKTLSPSFIDEYMKRGYYGFNLYCGNTASEVLGITKAQFKMLKTLDEHHLYDVHVLRYSKEISQKDFELLHENRSWMGYDYQKVIDGRKYTTIYKIIRYLKEHNVRVSDWADNAGMMERLEYPMTESDLFPKDFHATHQRVIEETNAARVEKKRKEQELMNKIISKQATELSNLKPLQLHIGGLFIRLPKDLEELKVEGKTLHHCVATYADRVAKKETMILFIRKEDDPDTPYYTLEWKGTVIQCRGSHNCSMTDEVKKFVDRFSKEMEKAA